jgi:hypothetical protein
LPEFFNAIDVLTNVVFGLDIFVNFISPYERKDGSYEVNFKKIAVNYLTGFFIMDLVSTLPYSNFFSDNSNT